MNLVRRNKKTGLMWRLAALWILVTLCIGQLPVNVFAAENIPSQRLVKIGCFTSSGYHVKNEDGEIAGYGHAYEALLAQFAGWKISYVEGNWSQLQQMLAEGDIDLLGFLVDTPEREQIYDFADYRSGSSTSCLIAANDNEKYAYEGFDIFDGMRVAYQEKNANASAFELWCEERGFHTKLVPCGSYQEVYEAINSGKVDAGLATNFYDLSGFKIIANISTVDFYYAVKKGDTKLLDELNQAIDSMRTYYPNIETSLYSKYFEYSNGRGETFSNEELSYLAKNPVVTVTPGGRGEPFEVYDASTGKYTGFVPDVLDKISEITGIQFVYDSTTSRKDFMNKAVYGDVVTAMTSDPDWAAEHKLKVTQPFINADISVVTKDGKKDIQTVGMGRDDYLIRHLEEEHSGCVVKYYNTMEERLDAVFDGKVDAVIMNDYEADYYLSTGKYKLLNERISSDAIQNIGFGVSYGSNPVLFSIMSKALLMIDSDTYGTLMRNHMTYMEKTDLSSLIYTNPVQILIIAVIGFLMMAIILFLAIYVNSIRKKNREVLAATQVKTDFFSRMSHDMRTPMNGILGMTALSKGETDNAVLQHNILEIENSGQYMLSLINDTLDLQKLETGKMKLDIQPMYAKDFFGCLVDMMRPNAEAKGITFEVENINLDLEHDVYLDQTRIKQVFTNLLSNAIKFTPQGGIVRFTGEAVGRDGDMEHDRFQVIDSGIGMSKEFIENGIFHPYSQEDTTITSKYGGTGLGLAITKNIVEAMGGTVSVESTPGEGTCFTILLDFKVAPGKISVVKTDEAEKSGELPAALNGKRILLCEDHPLNAEIVRRLLEKAGCEIVHASDGKLGVEQMASSRQHYFDAILMDIRMPNMDGLAATKLIRAMEREDAKTIPIIAMTANAFEEDIQKCREAGMNAHLAKPVEPERLYGELASWIAG